MNPVAAFLSPVFGLLSVAALICLVISVRKPESFRFLFKDKTSKFVAVWSFGSVLLFCAVIGLILASQPIVTRPQIAAKEEVAQAESRARAREEKAPVTRAFTKQAGIEATKAEKSRVGEAKETNVSVATQPQTLSQHHVDWLEYSPNGKWLAAGEMDFLSAVWDVKAGRRLFNLAGSVVFSPDDMLVLKDWNSIQSWNRDPIFSLWNLRTEKPVRQAMGKEAQVKFQLWDSQRVKMTRSTVPGQDGIYLVARWPDGKTLACGRGMSQTLRLWNARSGRLLKTFKEHYGPVQPLVFSLDATTVASYGYDRTDGRIHRVVRVWDVSSGKLLQQIQVRPGRYGLNIALSCDGRSLATAPSGGDITLWPIR